MADSDRAKCHTSDLASFWRRLDRIGRLFVHPDDLPFFREFRPHDLVVLDAESVGRHDRAAHHHFNHLSLLPAPYIGCLATADIFVLTLNPGYSQAEYRVEADPTILAGLKQNLDQDFNGSDWLFWYLSPNAAGHPGGRYWWDRLKGHSSPVAIGQRLAVIERFPYHSKKFGSSRLAQRLPSCLAARRYVHDVVLPKVLRDDVLLIVARGATAFGFSSADQRHNLIVYGPGETAGAKLTSGSRGGIAIANWIQAHPLPV